MTLAVAAVIACACAALLDYALARYNLALRDRRHHRAGLWSVAVALLGAYGVLVLVEERWLIVPQCAGYYLGTVLGARAHERRSVKARAGCPEASATLETQAWRFELTSAPSSVPRSGSQTEVLASTRS